MHRSPAGRGADDEHAAGGGVRNELSHVSGAVVQAGHIGGDVIVHAAAVAPSLPVPRQVPLLSSRFVNRVAEFARVSDVLDPAGGGGVRIVLIFGMPGVGKSSFTWRLVEQVRDRYSGGQLYVDFSAAGPERPDAVGDVLTRFLLALGVAKDVVPSGIAEKVSLYRSMTAERPMLVVLDKVTEPAQVLPFRPNAPGSAVLVTSTDRLTDLLLDGAEPMPMEPLDDADAERMLVELSGRGIATEAEAVAALVRQCGGLPIALQVAAARLRARPALSVAALVAEIADEHGGLDAFALRGQSRVAAVFAVAYAGLADQPARLFRVLGLLPGRTITVDLAAAAAGGTDEATEEALAYLHEVNLVAEEDGRFRLHELVRRYASNRALAVEPEGERIEALHRAVRHVVVWAAFGDLAALGPDRLRCVPHEVVLAGRSDPFAHEDPRTREHRGLDWMDTVRPTALGLLRIATDLGWSDEAWQLAESMTALFAVRRYLVDWTEFSELGARAARAAGNAAAEARLRSFASRAWADLGDLPRARRELDAAFALAGSVRHTTLMASIWEMEGRYRDDIGHHGGAVSAYAQAIALFEEAQAPRGVAFVTSFLGASLLAQGEPRQAADVLTRAQAMIRAVGNNRMEGEALISLAAARHQLGDDRAARTALAAALALSASGGYRFQQAWAYETLATIEQDSGESDAAVTSLRAALAIHETLRGPQAALLRERIAALTGGDESQPGDATDRSTP